MSKSDRKSENQKRKIPGSLVGSLVAKLLFGTPASKLRFGPLVKRSFQECVPKREIGNEGKGGGVFSHKNRHPCENTVKMQAARRKGVMAEQGSVFAKNTYDGGGCKNPSPAADWARLPSGAGECISK